jgi:uncharacterized membrane protein YoaK (UPF0700 family)
VRPDGSPSPGRGAEVLDQPVPTLLALTFVSGLADGTSFVGLGQVFTANMTGNILFLGFALGGYEELGVVAPLVSLGGFVVGALAGGVLALRMRPRRRAWVLTAMAGELAMMVAALVAAVALNASDTGDARLPAIALLASAFGIRNATVRRLGVLDLPTTILTLTLTGLAADSRAVGGEAPRQSRRAGAIAAMLIGAVVGALLVNVDVVLALAVTAGTVAVIAADFAVRTRPARALA